MYSLVGFSIVDLPTIRKPLRNNRFLLLHCKYLVPGSFSDVFIGFQNSFFANHFRWDRPAAGLQPSHGEGLCDDGRGEAVQVT
jgi:hypothetical protein